jgi:hypothetical protein
MWWETYQITHPIDGLDWDTFREGVRNAHISPGVMSVKKDEFHSLRQGGRSLKEYKNDFCSLSRYATIPLSVAYAPNYKSLPD